MGIDQLPAQPDIHLAGKVRYGVSLHGKQLGRRSPSACGFVVFAGDNAFHCQLVFEGRRPLVHSDAHHKKHIRQLRVVPAAGCGYRQQNDDQPLFDHGRRPLPLRGGDGLKAPGCLMGVGDFR
ncbi:hypothetical protein D3C76_1495970 [compost metagenome]